MMDTADRLQALRTGAAYDFFQKVPLPAFHIDRKRGIYMVNVALARTFGYEDPKVVEDVFRKSMFFPTHFSPDIVAQFYELASADQLKGWLMRGKTLDGRELILEVTAKIRLINPEGPAEYAEAIFTEPGDSRSVESFLEKAKCEAELAMNAKNEFLSNISHELRTPLNIIIGMLNLAVDDEDVGLETRENLSLAKNAADGLFSLLNDLILLSNLEARRLTSDMAQFTPELLVQSLVCQFAAKAAEKNISLRVDLNEFRDTIFDGGYNLINMAMEKLLHNAIKFGRENGEVIIKAEIDVRNDGPWLQCEVSDDGPGLDESFLDGREDLFRQGDGSMNRKHGGLGLGLRLAGSLVRHLGGDMILNNRAEGGASPRFRIPVKFSNVEFAENE
ncbi:hypothetical protein C4J81_09660 [Deltaproteobacteria bacterium Smac51]|nr:hypothetical protein C4J81_09660 [Deltaproteobacteria bacterium Smac51]